MEAVRLPMAAPRAEASRMCNVDLATGQLDEVEFDFEIPGPIPIRMIRTYRSTHVTAGDLGPGWGHEFGIEFSDDLPTNRFAFRGAGRSAN